MKKIISVLVFLLLAGCSDSGSDNVAHSPTPLENLLESNTTWPYAIEGVLDIIKAGGLEESEYPHWAVGFLIAPGSGNGLLIEIGEGIANEGRINVDSGKKIKVWLSQPKIQHGVKTYPIVKMRSI
jgi:hypothetical protein